MLVWQKKQGGTHYELRRAGGSLRLYSNGVFHSQFRRDHILNGGVWDLLWLPLFFRERHSVSNVLMLGLGAGAAAAKILQYFPAAALTAVEIDGVHIRVARRFTGLSKPRATLINANAIHWIEQSKDTFDVIIDDLFGHTDGEPTRAIGLLDNDRQWVRQLKKHLTPSGLLVVNGFSARESGDLRASRAATQGGFKHAQIFRQSAYSNVVSVYSDHELNRELYRRQLESAAGSQAGKGTLRRLQAMSVRRAF